PASPVESGTPSVGASGPRTRRKRERFWKRWRRRRWSCRRRRCWKRPSGPWTSHRSRQRRSDERRWQHRRATAAGRRRSAAGAGLSPGSSASGVGPPEAAGFYRGSVERLGYRLAAAAETAAATDERASAAAMKEPRCCCGEQNNIARAGEELGGLGTDGRHMHRKGNYGGVRARVAGPGFPSH
ncbi:unnamed protein product, partial [Phaeothamnion confervicola]